MINWFGLFHLVKVIQIFAHHHLMYHMHFQLAELLISSLSNTL